MDAQGGLRLAGETLNALVEGAQVQARVLQQVPLGVQEVRQVPGGQAAEKHHQQAVHGALELRPVLGRGEERGGPQQHCLRGTGSAQPREALPAAPPRASQRPPA